MPNPFYQGPAQALPEYGTAQPEATPYQQARQATGADAAQRAVAQAIRPAAGAGAGKSTAPSASPNDPVNFFMKRMMEKADEKYVDPGESPAVKKARELIDKLSQPTEIDDQAKARALMQMGFKMMASRSPFFGNAVGEAGSAGLDELQKEKAAAAQEAARRAQLQLTGINMEMKDEERRDAARMRHEDRADRFAQSAATIGMSMKQLEEQARHHQEQMRMQGRQISVTEAHNEVLERQGREQGAQLMVDGKGNAAGWYFRDGSYKPPGADKALPPEAAKDFIEKNSIKPYNVYNSGNRDAASLERAKIQAAAKAAASSNPAVKAYNDWAKEREKLAREATQNRVKDNATRWNKLSPEEKKRLVDEDVAATGIDKRKPPMPTVADYQAHSRALEDAVGKASEEPAADTGGGAQGLPLAGGKVDPSKLKRGTPYIMPDGSVKTFNGVSFE